MDVRLKEPQRYRALLVDAELGRQQFLRSLLEDRGFMVVGSYPSVKSWLETRDAPRADLLLLYAAGHQALDDVRAARAKHSHPILLISESDAPDHIVEAVKVGADAVLPIGLNTDRIRCAAYSAMATFERMQALGVTAERLRQKLERRKLVERAKGILMSQRQISEPDAFREIQKASMQRNVPMPEIARSIIAAKELLG